MLRAPRVLLGLVCAAPLLFGDIPVSTIAWLSSSELAAAETGSTGGGQPHNNIQPSLGVNAFMPLQGIYPPQVGTPPDELFMGAVRMFAGSFAPGGVPFTEGQLLPIAQNQALFSLLGDNYGGNGQTTFALPDLRSRASIGMGAGPGLTNRIRGAVTGAADVTLTEVNLPAHSHTLLSPPGVTGLTGGDQPFTNMQPSQALNYIIATEGFHSAPNANAGGKIFMGQTVPFAGSFAPAGWEFAHGQILPISENADLFSVIGDAYGGDGQLTFALPDLRGRTPVSAGTGPGLPNRPLGASFGTEEVTLTEANLPAHDHTLPPTADLTGLTGGDQPISNMQPSLALHYIVATQGIFPPRVGGVSGETQLGEVSLFAGDFAPGGWALANGQLLSIAQNTAIFALVGTTYGGNGQTTFALPDLRGRTLLHAGTGATLLGETPGVSDITLTIPQMAPHVHDVPVPEPSTWLLLALASPALLLLRRRGQHT